MWFLSGWIPLRAQARKVENTPFPFPYAQLLAFMLYTFAAFFPLLAASKVGSDGVATMWISPLLTFIVVLSCA